MSLIPDTLLSLGSTRLHSATARNKPGASALRKSKSQGGLLAPLVQLVRDPVGTLSYAVSSDEDIAQRKALPAADVYRRQILYLRLSDAKTYNEWKDAATELDALEGNNPWKEDDASPEYDAELITLRLKELDDARLSCDVAKILYQLRTALTRDLGGMGDLSLYKHSHIGTKKLIERYIESVNKTLVALQDVSAKQGDQCPISPRRLVDQIKQTRQSFGRSALMLSGGGTFGMNHIGVVKCLWDHRLLPRIISGASAGSIVAAVLCSKTDAEIPVVMHEFCYGDLDVFEKVGESEFFLSKVVRMFKTGGLFDISHLRRVMKGILGDMTFLEAYRRTQRILNIPVSSSAHFELPKLLNYITAPNVAIWSAICTSCSVPLVYKKATLLAKDPKTRKLRPWDPNPDATYIDGSVQNDLPMSRLSELFNVNHFIVSQVNPHVVPFLEKDEVITEAMRHISAGPRWLRTALGISRGELVHRMQIIVDLGIMPGVLHKLHSILNQRYSGDINIFPQISLVDFPRVLSNPTPEYMVGCMLAGQRATWPKLSRIQNHVAIELALDAAVHEFEGRAMYAERKQDNRRNLSRPASAGNDLSHSRRSKSTNKITRFNLSMEPPRPAMRNSAPTSPLLSRASPQVTSLHTLLPSKKTGANSTRRRSDATEPKPFKTTAFQIVSPSTNEEDITSTDCDYFAEIDSDTSPVTSPTTYAPHVDLSPSPHILRQTVSQPTTPVGPFLSVSPTSTSSDRRNGILLNLSMTSATPAAPSSPELRYKRLFHPPQSATRDASVGAAVSQEPKKRRTSVSSSGNQESRVRRISTSSSRGAEFALDMWSARTESERKKSGDEE